MRNLNYIYNTQWIGVRGESALSITSTVGQKTYDIFDFDELFAVQRHADMHHTGQLVADLMDILSVESPTILRGCLEATGSSGLAIHRHGPANDESTK